MPLLRAEFVHRRPRLESVLKHDVSQVLYLPFDKDDGSYARDRSGYNNHGTVYGASRVAGKIGSALNFDGVDDYVQIPDSPTLKVTGDSTFMTWVTLKTLSPIFQIVMTKHYDYEFDWGILSTGEIRFHHGDGAFESGDSVDAGIVAGVPHHLCCVRTVTPKEVKFYVGAEFVSTWTYAKTVVASTNPVYVGYRTFEAKWPLNGLLDEPRIFNRALSQAEIRRVMNMRGI